MHLKSLIKLQLIKRGYYTKPAFLIIGAQKSGTTYLYSLLKRHPQIIEPGWKEIHFFDDDINFSKGKHWYYSRFYLPYKTRNKITFEATPDYFANIKAPERIKEILNKTKLILLLRDPVKRAYSAWNMHHHLFKEHIKHKNLFDPRSFEQAIKEEMKKGPVYHDGRDYLEYGKYDKHLNRFLKYFNIDDFLIIDWMDLINKEKKILASIHDFIGVKSHIYSTKIKKKSNFWDNKGTYKSNIDKETKIFLDEYYDKYNKNLQSLLGKKFSWMD